MKQEIVPQGAYLLLFYCQFILFRGIGLLRVEFLKPLWMFLHITPE